MPFLLLNPWLSLLHSTCPKRMGLGGSSMNGCQDRRHRRHDRVVLNGRYACGEGSVRRVGGRPCWGVTRDPTTTERGGVTTTGGNGNFGVLTEDVSPLKSQPLEEADIDILPLLGELGSWIVCALSRSIWWSSAGGCRDGDLSVAHWERDGEV